MRKEPRGDPFNLTRTMLIRVSLRTFPLTPFELPPASGKFSNHDGKTDPPRHIALPSPNAHGIAVGPPVPPSRAALRFEPGFARNAQ